MVVDWFLNSNSIFDCFNLFIHEIKIIGSWVKSSDTLLLSASSIQRVVIIQAYNSGGVTDESVGIRVATLWRFCSSSKHTGEPPHEGTFSTTWISSKTNHHCLLVTGCTCYHIASATVAAPLAVPPACGVEHYLLLVKTQLCFWWGWDGAVCAQRLCWVHSASCCCFFFFFFFFCSLSPCREFSEKRCWSGGLLRKLHSKNKFGTHIKYEVELKPKQKAVKQKKKKKGIFLFEFLWLPLVLDNLWMIQEVVPYQNQSATKGYSCLCVFSHKKIINCD